jgi:transcriptional regulator with PAS, ATPase and Fis domain
VRNASDRTDLHRKVMSLSAQVADDRERPFVTGPSRVMRDVLDLVRKVAGLDTTVLILGESGTGKELMARAIHAESPRSHGPFVAVSCAALTETLLESELFGHERGSFTGAIARQRGKFEMANHGTLFLDEIGDITPKLQLDLLRVLEERTFHRVGGTEAVQVDVRIVAATNRDLKKAVANGTFREDLYYRLNVIPVSIPPLRDRREDIPLLVDHLLEQLGVEAGRTIDGVSHDAMSMLMTYDWPGNVRELRNILERAVVVASGAVIQPGDIGLHRPSERGSEPVGLLSLDEIERRHIAAVLEHTGGNITQAARILDIDRVTLYNKIKKYHLREIESA